MIANVLLDINEIIYENIFPIVLDIIINYLLALTKSIDQVNGFIKFFWLLFDF